MRYLIAFLLGITLAYSGISQQNIYTSLKPSKIVEETKNAGEKFNDISIFEYSAEKKSIVNDELRAHKALTLDVEQLQKLTYDAPSQLNFKLPANKNTEMVLELVQVNLFDANFAVIESSTNQAVNVSQGVHYRGIIKGNPNSMVAVSIFEDEIMGLISSAATGNLVLARLNQKNNREDYILYNDEDVIKRLDAYCDTADAGDGYTKEQLNYSGNGDKTVGDCVRIYFEVDHDIYNNKGGTTGASNYIAAIFNQSATLYANDNISLVISQIYVWNTTSPYSGTSSGTLLTQFQNHRTSFNGDLAQLVSYQASGGIAVLSGLCHPFNSARMSFASVGSTFASVPTYSFTVMVMTHELGHLLGAHHTHACVWNGNNTAIDGCAGFTEGSCGNPGTPSNGGTIMSYCHITSAGVNFNLGFGIQPGNVIRSMIDNATCLQPCSNGGGNGGGGNASNCDENELFLTVIIDDFGSENSWDLKNSAGSILYSGGTFAKSSAGLIIRDTLCVPDGCYTFTMYDSYGDGMCCTYGEGSYVLKDATGNVFLEGGEFTNEEISDFCAPYETGGGSDDCIEIDFADYNIDSYGGGQDAAGTYQLLSNNTILKIANNAWKSIALDYEVTANTVIDFEFRSTIQGEIHAIGFDDNSTISYNRTLKVYGTQNWGIQDYNDYTGNGGWQTFSIPVGEFYQGAFDRLFFVADHDSGQHNGNSYYRNIKIREGAGCSNDANGENDPSLAPKNEENVTVYPNPASSNIQIDFSSAKDSHYNISFYNMMGQEVKHLSVETTPGQNSAQIDVSQLPQGTYILRLGEGERAQTQRLVITRE